MRAILAIFILLIAIFLIAGCVGFYYLCNSRAVEYMVGRLADAGARLIDQVGIGLFWFLIACALAVGLLGLGYGIRAGAEPAGKAAILMMAAPAVRGAIERQQTARLPGPFTVERPQTGSYQLEEENGAGHLLSEGYSQRIASSDGSHLRFTG